MILQTTTTTTTNRDSFPFNNLPFWMSLSLSLSSILLFINCTLSFDFYILLEEKSSSLIYSSIDN
ncbi:hypothetical protein DERP_014828 [Dermatophagoides pteronyssinus]|uniref:Uncharacterized protein n=1 Tax=Dermatophagoides pteronyssinus TaxID=6956 RepID=A0ABQ8J2X3_DERPT|nr:hypothetical protein DERP_014828 [Dermatophagoides pteronyssinus]